MTVRPMQSQDRPQVLAMMGALWPGESGFLNSREKVWVWEGQDRRLGGFISFSVRPFANGCDSAPVPFVEGWYVRPAMRRRGVGAALMGAVETWCMQHGYRELGSDTELWRRTSIRVHGALGFEATERVQYFRKRLPPGATRRKVRAATRPGGPRPPRPARRGRGPR